MPSLSSFTNKLLNSVKSINPRHKHSWVYKRQVLKKVGKSSNSKKYVLHNEEKCGGEAGCGTTRFIIRGVK